MGILHMLRLTFLVGGLCLLMLVGWLGFLRADEVTESNMIVFVSDRDEGRWGLYIMAADGSDTRPILEPVMHFEPKVE
jgi:hypothetical protein